jgi:tyrosyl-tRNA synthetase
MPGGFDILKERGFIKQCSDEATVKQLLDTETVTFYTGFDPTGPSLHVGHMVPLFAMAHLQRAGHKPIALVGGGTACIGDPTGKTEMRKMISVEEIKRNTEFLKKQIARFISFEDAKAELVDNYDWLAPLNYINFLRDIGRHFSVNRMLSFETYKMRLETGLSFIEFNYQLLQSYDFLVLFRQYGCLLQLGGDDQWGNIVSGMELIRRVEGKEAQALTFGLITRSDGKKMGKTEKGSVFLNPEMTAPYDFYQYWINVPDDDVEKFLLIFTFLPVAEIKNLCRVKGSELNRAKERLAYELTGTVHGAGEADKTRAAAQALFSGNGGDVAAMPSAEIKADELKAGINVLDLFARTSLCSSKGEARRLVTQGGAMINDEPLSDINRLIDMTAVKDGAVMLRAGKKRYFRIVIVD